MILWLATMSASHSVSLRMSSGCRETLTILGKLKTGFYHSHSPVPVKPSNLYHSLVLGLTTLCLSLSKQEVHFLHSSTDYKSICNRTVLAEIFPHSLIVWLSKFIQYPKSVPTLGGRIPFQPLFIILSHSVAVCFPHIIFHRPTLNNSWLRRTNFLKVWDLSSWFSIGVIVVQLVVIRKWYFKNTSIKFAFIVL